MATPATERRTASWAEFEALQCDRAEYVDGEIVVVDAPSQPHQRACRRMANLIEEALPDGYAVDLFLNWKTRRDQFEPDVMVYRTAELTDTKRFTGVPLLCVEVLSPSNAANDWLVKTRKYAEAGLDAYWILNLDPLQLDVLERKGQSYFSPTQQVGDEPAVVSFGGISVTIDLASLTR